LLFQTFYTHWGERVLRHRLPADLAHGVRMTFAGAAQFEFFDRVLRGDLPHWLAPLEISVVACDVLDESIAWIASRLGDDRERWTWGALHQLEFIHPFGDAGGRISKAARLGPFPLAGDRTTICMSWWPPDELFKAKVGPSMRMVADLSRPDGLWITNTLGQQGTPRVRHSRDQLGDYLDGLTHPVPASKPRRWKAFQPA
jgi:acyl-homoserine lactone acylase PvdQ